MMNKFSAIEQAWLDHAYDGFPRKCGTPSQKLIHSQEDYLQYIWSMLGRTDLYTALFSETTKEAETYYRMYFDLDNEKFLRAAYLQMREIENWFYKETNINPTTYFSGKKGFAIYFYFKPRKFEEYQYTCRAIADEIKDTLGINTLDESVVGDTSRISRVPFTKHISSGLYCIPVYRYQGFDTIMTYCGKYPLEPHIEINIADGINDWLKEYEEKGKAKKEELAEKMGNGREYGWNLDTILYLAPKLIGARRSLIYTVIIPKMWQEGQSYHNIVKYVKEFIKHSGSSLNNIEKVVERHLRYTKMGKSVMWSQQAFFEHNPWAYNVFNGG